MPPETKATGLISFYEVLREMAPPERLAAFLAELPPDTAHLLEKPPFPTAWLPSFHFMRIAATAQRVIFDGDDQPLFELGRNQIGRDLNSIYKLLVRMVTNPQMMIDRATRIWKTYSRGGGELRVIDRKSHEVELEYVNVPYPFPGFWIYIAGTILGVSELSGAREIQVRLVSGGGMTGTCRYRVTWR